MNGGVALPGDRRWLAAGGVALLAVAWLLRDALVPLAVGLVVACLLEPAVGALTARGVRRGAAAALVCLTVVALVLVATRLVVGSALSQAAALADDLPAGVAALDRAASGVYRAFGLAVPERGAIPALLGDGSDLVPRLAGPLLATVRAAAGSLLSYVVVPIWVFYVLKDGPRLAGTLSSSLPDDVRDRADAALAIAGRVFVRWLRGQLFLGAIVGLLTLCGLLALDAIHPGLARFALVLALIAGVLELLPIVGPLLSLVPAALFASTISPEAALAVAVLYLAVQLVENNLLVPHVQGSVLRLHPLGIILALVVGGAVAGIVGAVLGPPLLAVAVEVARDARVRGGERGEAADRRERGVVWTDREPEAAGSRPGRLVESAD